MIKSPLRYPGGKSRAMKFLQTYIPPFAELREPFFGGGSFTFYCVQTFPKAKFCASDLNYDVFCLWQQLKINSEEVLAAVADIKANYEDGRVLYKEILARRNDTLSDFQRAVDFFILNRITFSGVADAGGYSNMAFEKRFTDSSVERLRKAAQIVKRVDFSATDYTYLLEKEGENVFIFLDPPYFSATKSRLYGKKGVLHTGFDHERFYESLKICKHKWLITYDNSEYIKERYKDFYILDWELQYGMNNYKSKTAAKGKEVLIGNFDFVTMAETKKKRKGSTEIF